MAKGRQTRRKASGGIFSYIYNPIHQLIGASDNVTSAATNTVRKIVHNSATGVDSVGTRLTRRADKILSGLIPRGLNGKRATRRSRRSSSRRSRR